MALIECPKCRFKYDPSYKKCPMCEEDRLKRRGKRTSGRKIPGKKQRYSVVAAIAVTLGAVLLMMLPLLLSDRIAGLGLGMRGKGNDQNTAAEGSNSGQSAENEKDGDAETPKNGIVSLNRTELSLTAENRDFQLEVSDNTETPVWISGDERIASVSESGLVSAVGDGEAVISAEVDGQKLQCTVSVRGIPSGEDSDDGTAVVDIGEISLNHTDFTAVIGEKVQMKVCGTDAPVTWSIADLDGSIATISSDGVVTAVGKGRTTVYAEVGSEKLECIVRVSGGG